MLSPGVVSPVRDLKHWTCWPRVYNHTHTVNVSHSPVHYTHKNTCVKCLFLRCCQNGLVSVWTVPQDPSAFSQSSSFSTAAWWETDSKSKHRVRSHRKQFCVTNMEEILVRIQEDFEWIFFPPYIQFSVTKAAEIFPIFCFSCIEDKKKKLQQSSFLYLNSLHCKNNTDIIDVNCMSSCASVSNPLITHEISFKQMVKHYVLDSRSKHAVILFHIINNIKPWYNLSLLTLSFTHKRCVGGTRNPEAPPTPLP